MAGIASRLSMALIYYIMGFRPNKDHFIWTAESLVAEFGMWQTWLWK